MSNTSPLPIDPKNTTLDAELLEIMPRMLIEEFRAFVFEKGDKPKVGAVNPKNPALKQYLAKKLGKNIEWFKVTEEDIIFMLKNCKKDFKADILRLASTANEANNNISRTIDDIINFAFDISDELGFQCMGYDFIVDNNKKIGKIVEMSYGFSHTALMQAKGYWDRNEVWYEEPLNSPEEVIKNLLN